MKDLPVKSLPALPDIQKEMPKDTSMDHPKGELLAAGSCWPRALLAPSVLLPAFHSVHTAAASLAALASYLCRIKCLALWGQTSGTLLPAVAPRATHAQPC